MGAVMWWKTILWTLIVLLSSTGTLSEPKAKARDSNQDLFILPDTQNDGSADDVVESGSGAKTDTDTKASGIGPDDEDATKEGSGTQPLETSTPSRQLTPCQQLRLASPNFKNTYIPKCTLTGMFEKRQCRGDETCWCVDPHGGQIMGTTKIGDMTNPREQPDCESGSNLSPCITLLVKNQWDRLLGSRKPRCKPDGKFDPMQCHERECWCVDSVGRVIAGSAKISPDLPNCAEVIHHVTEVTRRPVIHKHPTTDMDISLVEHGQRPAIDGSYHVPGGSSGSINIDQDDTETDDEHHGSMHHGKNPATEGPEATPIPLIEQPGILAGIIGGAVVGLLCAILLIMFIVYRVRKKDEGSYALDEPTKARGAYAYQKAPEKEFYA